jgi:hypothetical protein
MDPLLKSLFDTGRKLISDSKSAKPPASKKGKASLATEAMEPPETDPHKIFVKRAVREKPKNPEMIKEIKKFIEVAEKHL